MAAEHQMVAAVLMPPHVDAVAEDYPGTEEADAGHDVGGDPGRVNATLPAEQDGEQLEQGGTQGDQRIGPKPRRPLPPLPFEADCRTQSECHRGPRGKVADAGRLN